MASMVQHLTITINGVWPIWFSQPFMWLNSANFQSCLWVTVAIELYRCSAFTPAWHSQLLSYLFRYAVLVFRQSFQCHFLVFRCYSTIFSHYSKVSLIVSALLCSPWKVLAEMCALWERGDLVESPDCFAYDLSQHAYTNRNFRTLHLMSLIV